MRLFLEGSGCPKGQEGKYLAIPLGFRLTNSVQKGYFFCLFLDLSSVGWATTWLLTEVYKRVCISHVRNRQIYILVNDVLRVMDRVAVKQS